MMTDKLVVLSTCSSEAEAEKIARSLVEKQLAACVNIVPGIKSIYRWQGAIETGSEVLLVIKTSQSLFARLSDTLTAANSYDVPEIVALPITAGSESYLAWLDGTLLRPHS